MILRADRIAERLESGLSASAADPLVITPCPDLTRLRISGATSVDLRLGTWFLELRPARMAALEIDDAALQVQLSRSRYVPFGEAYYLHPGAFVLGVTMEWIRLPRSLAGYVIGRSSWGRRGLIIATAAGVHPGFRGCLTLELTNLGEIPIAISPGLQVCQLCLHAVDTAGGDEIDRSAFLGLRKPALGRIERDEIARKLAKGPLKSRL